MVFIWIDILLIEQKAILDNTREPFSYSVDKRFSREHLSIISLQAIQTYQQGKSFRRTKYGVNNKRNILLKTNK